MFRYAILAFALSVSAPALAEQLPGFGSSKAALVGDPWVLPPGVTLKQPLYAYNSFDSGSCKNEDEKEQRNPPAGVAGLVALCLSFHYEKNPMLPTQLPIQFIIPPGLTFESEHLMQQNGINIVAVTVSIRPGETINIPISLTCINPTRKSNTNLTDLPYRLGPIIRNKRMEEIFKITEKYNIPFYDASLGAVIANIGFESESNIQTSIKIMEEAMKNWPLKAASAP